MIFPLIRLVVWFLLWLLGLACLLLGLGLSPWGTAWLFAQGEQRGLFSVDSVSGAPLDQMTVSGLEMVAGPAYIQVGRLHLAWAEDCLLDGRLCLDTLQLENVDVRLREGTADEAAPADDTEAGGIPSLGVPFPIELRELELKNVDVQLADGTRLGWRRFSSGARLVNDTLTLLPTRLVDGAVDIPLSKFNQSQYNLITQDQETRLVIDSVDAAITVATVNVTAPDNPQPNEKKALPLGKREPISLPEIKLPISVQVPNLVIENFHFSGSTQHTIDRLALSLEGQGHDIRLHDLTLISPEVDANLNGTISLRENYPLEADLNAYIHREPIAGEQLALALDGNLGDLSAKVDASGPITMQLQAHADILDPTVPFEITLEAEQLEWPLPASGEDEAVATSPDSYILSNLALRANGDLTAYHTAISAAVSGAALPEKVHVTMTGSGDLESFAWAPLALSTDNGALVSRGEVRWPPDLNVNATLHLDRFSLDALTDAVSGRLSGNAQVGFTMDSAGNWQLDVPQLAIDGTLQDRPLALDARLSGNSAMRWNIQRLRLRQGSNRLTAQGRIGERMDLSGELDAPTLGTLLPELDGSAQGRFSVKGTFQMPQLGMALSGRHLRYAENTLERLRLEADIAGLEDPLLDVTLHVAGLSAAEQRISSAKLNLHGRLSQHRLDFTAEAGEGMPLSHAELMVEGGLNAERSRYRGRLVSLEVDSEQAELRLKEPTTFSVALDTGRVEVAPFCLARRQGGSLCASEPLQASAARGQAAFELRAFPMDLVSAALPGAWRAEGQSHGRLKLSWSGSGRWSAQADLESRLTLSGEDAYGQPWSLPASTLALHLDATSAKAQLRSRLALSDTGQLQLDLTIDDPAGTAVLDGQLRVDDILLSPYRALIADLQQFEGTLNGDIALSGTLNDPRLDGSLQLAGLRAAGGDIPLEVQDGRLAVQLQGDHASLEGFIEAEEGRLELQGTARWPAPGEWLAELSLDGTESPLLVVLPGFGRLRVAPDLEVDVSPELLRMRGQVRVPWGRLTVPSQSPPSTISPSTDELIITREEEARAQQEAQRAVQKAGEEVGEATAQALAEAGMRLDILIELILGPDVQLEAYGLETDLAGKLEVRQGNGPVQLFGDVNLVNGRYQAFGQDLLIRQGQVLFSGPASQPRLQFEAIRNPDATEDDVIAGLRVTGPADKPQLSIFSEPAMDESRALSYLLRGRAPDDAGADGALTSALIGLSLSRTGGAVGQIGQAFGINDLSLDTTGSGGDSQVVISGYLFEDLKVSYGVGVFSPIAQLTLRYQLFRNLYLQAVSGAAQAVDLIYTFSLGRSNAAP